MKSLLFLVSALQRHWLLFLMPRLQCGGDLEHVYQWLYSLFPCVVAGMLEDMQIAFIALNKIIPEER